MSVVHTKSTKMPVIPLYEQDSLRRAASDTLHPGGLKLTERLFEQCKLPPGSRLLDIGCGCGTSIAWLQKKYACCPIGVDISLKLLQVAVTKKVQITNAHASFLPFSTTAFDAVILECTLSVILFQEQPDV